jgi:hypothetical protein
MHLLRALRVLLPLALIVVVVAGITSVLSARPDLQHARRGVDSAWAPLSNELDQRYFVLTAADQKIESISGPVREIATQLDAALGAWRSTHGRGVAAEVRAANAVEALGRRLVAAALASNRVKQDQGAVNAINAFAQRSSIENVSQFNAAVERYERERRGPLRSVVAAVFGENDIPAFAPAVTA